MKESDLYLAKKGSDGMISSSVAMRTNLIPSYSLTHTEGGIESVDPSQFLSLLPALNFLFCMDKGKEHHSEVTHQ